MASPSRPRQIPSGTPSSPRRSSPSAAGSFGRSASNARLASPVPTAGRSPRPSVSQTPAEQATPIGEAAPLAGLDGVESRSYGQPRASALSSALSASIGRSPPAGLPQSQNTGHFHRSGSFADRQSALQPSSSFAPGSFRADSVRSHRRSSRGGQSPSREDFDVVRRHLVGPSDSKDRKESLSQGKTRKRGSVQGSNSEVKDGSQTPDLSEGFSSLQMKGGDIHRGIYRRTEQEASAKERRLKRSQSEEYTRRDAENQEMNAGQIKEPGGFRREHILRTQPSAALGPESHDASGTTSPAYPQRNFLTRNFYEFLTVYGHFAGEEEDEDEDEDEHEDEAEFGPEILPTGDEERDVRHENDERRPLLRRQTTTKKRRKEGPKSGTGGTILILLKSFVGTGVLFLPRAFLNGGMAFSVGVLLAVAAVSYYCFLLLTTSRLKLKASYAEMGELAYSRWLRILINSSLVISQIGFASAYIVFTSENLRAFVLAVSKGKTDIDIKLMILMQLIVFLPLSLYRNLSSLSYVVYIADIFIILGLVYLYYYDIATIAEYSLADIAWFNKQDWTLFIGTAVFTFEGIGLIIPIQDGMKQPEKLPSILLVVMLIIGTIFISMGALSYAAFGSETQTVIIKNMHQDNKFVNGVQFMYSLAILLSTPMQIYPVITILEKGIFARSGKFSKHVKWGKNVFRFGIVMVCALIAWVGANDLDKFVALVGSFACIPLVYIYPPLIHRRAVAGSRWKGVLDILLCVMGFVLMAYTSILTIASWITGSAGHEGSKSISRH